LQNTPTKIVIESYSAGASMIDKKGHGPPHKRQYVTGMKAYIASIPEPHPF
jgi:hypothetical protein